MVFPASKSPGHLDQARGIASNLRRTDLRELLDVGVEVGGAEVIRGELPVVLAQVIPPEGRVIALAGDKGSPIESGSGFPHSDSHPALQAEEKGVIRPLGRLVR